MRIAYIGDFINHGKTLVPTGTSLVLLLSEIPDVEVIDVYCPALNLKTEPFNKPEKVTIIEYYSYDDPFSITKLLRVRKGDYDTIIFNILPTAFGGSNLSNITGLLIPLILKVLFRENNIEVIYHNSVYTNDISMLGYDSLYDKLRSFFLGVLERIMFKSVKTFVFLQIYKDKITKKVGNNRVRVLNGRYLEAIATAYMNGVLDQDCITLPARGQRPIILMHGSWGPQKNLELGLNALSELRKGGCDFDLIISGGINHHFKEYEKEFNLLSNRYEKVIKQYLGFVNEVDIMKLFTEADLLILPYNTPGGHSAVLEQAMFFDLPTIAIDFPEYREQSKGAENVTLIESRHLNGELVAAHLKKREGKKVDVINKLSVAEDCVRSLLTYHSDRNYKA